MKETTLRAGLHTMSKTNRALDKSNNGGKSIGEVGISCGLEWWWP